MPDYHFLAYQMLPGTHLYSGTLSNSTMVDQTYNNQKAEPNILILLYIAS